MKPYSLLSRAALSMLLLFGGCASVPEEPPTAAELYAEAAELTNSANYDAADQKYAELKSTYPTSPYTQQAILDQIHDYLNRREFARTISSADEFINLYPDHPQTPYALYMKGITYFREDRGILDRIGKQDPTSRDPQLMQLSYEAFQQLLDGYPDSQYAADAADRMRYLVNSLAKGEMHIASYYYRRGAYPSAINRAQKVLEIYPDSTSTEDALALLFLAYQDIGEDTAAADMRRLLQLNYPGNFVLNDSKDTKPEKDSGKKRFFFF